ncbi:MAG: DUF2442 domain-containing protein [Xenococcus sp. (in: cyanobacteria)]
MFLHVTEAKYFEEYKVEVTFNDDRKGIADFENALSGKVFEPLKDLKLFSQLKVDSELETIVWPNGVDFAPEYIYFLAFQDIPTLQPQFREWGYITELNTELSRA